MIPVVSNRAIQSLFVLLFQTLLLSSGCENQTADVSEDGKGKTKTPNSRQEEPLVEVDWGLEVNLDEMIAMARQDRIREIQWHVMPNILRAEASDGEVFHLRNENKGVDLRNRLIDAGVGLGKNGVRFRHVF